MADHPIRTGFSRCTGVFGRAVRNSGTASKCWAFAALTGVIALTGCVAPMPEKEGPRARLISGIAEPRDRNNMDITLYEYSITAWGKCLELASTRSPVCT